MRDPDRIVRLKTVLVRTGLSRSTIYRKIAEATFPAQLKISINGCGWLSGSAQIWRQTLILRLAHVAHRASRLCFQACFFVRS
jgi:prophage regulatory protein